VIPTDTGLQPFDSITWKGYDCPDVAGGRIGDLKTIRALNGSLYSRWKAETWRERLRFLFTGQLWIGVRASRATSACPA